MSLLQESKERLEPSPRILVTGADGLVGSRFCELCTPEYESFFPTDISELDILDKKAIESWVEKKKPEVLINFAAMTNVDQIEKERQERENSEAYLVNAVGARNLAEVCRENGIFFVQISTDFVFTGFPPNVGPYPEDAQTAQKPNEISWYGWTKLMGEKAVQEAGGDFAIVRIAYPFRALFERPDFARRILKLHDEGKLYPMFIDQLMTPTFIDELAKALQVISENRASGIYHVASREVTTSYSFASYLVYKFRDKRDMVEPGWLSKFRREHPRSTPRPQGGGFKVIETQKRLGMKFMSWDEAIDEMYQQNPDL